MPFIGDMGDAIKLLAFLLLIVGMGAGFILFVFPLHLIPLPVLEAPPTPSITILNHTGEIDTHSGTYIVRGTAKNTGTVPVVKVYVVVTTYDENETEIGPSYDALLNVTPGEEKTFRVEARPYYLGIKVAQYNIIPRFNFIP
jgi:hypothetical protein